VQQSFKIPLTKAKQVLEAAMALAYHVYCDELDCSKSFSRQPTNKTPQEVFEIGLKTPRTLYTFIYRDWEKKFFDVGLSTIGQVPNYFLWISLDIENGEKLIKKFKLKSL
jgi:hypothetical protein